MRRIKLLLASLGLLFCLVPAGTAAAQGFDFFQPCESGNASDASVCQDGQAVQTQEDNTIYGPNGIITKVANILALIVGVAAVIIIIVAGIQYMLSTGDATKVNNSKNAIIYAVVGLVVVVLARTLVVFVIGKVGN